jgi:protein gp37
MGENSAIEWTNHTFNPWVGCTKISPGCDNCYAETWAKRSGLVTWGETRRRTSPANWRKPLQWNAEAARSNTRARVFCASLADVFDNEVDPEWRRDLFSLIAKTKHLDWLLLTKRIGNAAKMLDDVSVTTPSLDPKWWPNVWLGITVVNQEEADRDILKLLQIPARVRFLSCEPLLGELMLSNYLQPPATLPGRHVQLRPAEWIVDADGAHTIWRGIDWIIVGGESGHRARALHPQWAKNIRDQCVSANVPYLFKQWGQFLPAEDPRAQAYSYEDDSCEHQWDESTFGHSIRVRSKHQAGRLLDGRTWDEFPV